MSSIPPSGSRRDLSTLPGADRDPERGPLSLPEVRIAFFYVLLASLWIVGSDCLLDLMAQDASMTIFLHSFKGLNFVVTTGILLYLVLRRAFGGWRRSEEKRLAEIAASGARFRRLSSRIQTLREEERTRISREIHDELGQLLTGIKMKLRLVENFLERREDRSLNLSIDNLVEASAMIDETIASVRRISSGLRPQALDHLGLASALDEEAEQFTRRTGIHCHLKVGEIEASIRPGVETTAFRIFQESLTNVARHSKATEVEAECGVSQGTLVMRIRDNGVGIDPAIAGNPVSLGLVGMLERASDVGGSLEFRSSSGRGTEVILQVPVTVGAKDPIPLSS